MVFLHHGGVAVVLTQSRTSVRSFAVRACALPWHKNPHFPEILKVERFVQPTNPYDD